MIVHNITCNVALPFEKKWLEWIDLKLQELSKSDFITSTSILKLDDNNSTEGSVYALQYHISDRENLQCFLKKEDMVLKEQIKTKFGEAVLHFSSQLQIIKQY